MACQEHFCSLCGWQGFDNEKWKNCPMCKSDQVSNWFDEEADNFSEPEIMVEEE